MCINVPKSYSGHWNHPNTILQGHQALTQQDNPVLMLLTPVASYSWPCSFFVEVPTKLRSVLDCTQQPSAWRLEIISNQHRWGCSDTRSFPACSVLAPQTYPCFSSLGLWTLAKTQWKFSGLSHKCQGNVLGKKKEKKGKGKRGKRYEIWASLSIIQSVFCVRGFYLLPSLAQTKLFPLAPRRGDSYASERRIRFCLIQTQ